jgi:hypothetical protein
MRLVRRHVGPGAERILADPEDEQSVARPLLSFLSQRAVAAEVSNNPDPFPRCGSTSGLRSSWRSQSDFVADLLAFGLWSLHQPVLYDSRFAAETEQLIDGPDFVETAHRLCLYEFVNMITGPSFHLAMVATVAADGDPVIQEALAENRAGSLASWRQLYDAVFQARRLRLRPGLSLDDFAEIIASLATGFARRSIAGSNAKATDHEQQRSLFGTAFLAIFMSCVVRVDRDEPDARTIEDAATDLVYASTGEII